MNIDPEEIKKNIENMKKKMGASSQIGGKGTQRRHAKHVQKSNVKYC